MTPACLVPQTATTKGPSPAGNSPGIPVSLLSLATLPAAMGCNPQTLRPILEPEDLNPTSLKMRMGPQGLQEDFPGHKENKCQSKSCSGFKM